MVLDNDEMMRGFLECKSRQELLEGIENALKEAEDAMQSAVRRFNSTEAFDRMMKAIQLVVQELLSKQVARENEDSALTAAKVKHSVLLEERCQL